MSDIVYNWNSEKNELLKASERNISFEVVVSAIQNNQVLEIIDNPSSNHYKQKCYVLDINEYVYLVPFIEKGNEVFLKTIFPSRKHKKFYMTKRKKDEK